MVQSALNRSVKVRGRLLLECTKYYKEILEYFMNWKDPYYNEEDFSSNFEIVKMKFSWLLDAKKLASIVV